MAAYEDYLATLTAPAFRWTFNGTIAATQGGLNGEQFAGSPSFVPGIIPNSSLSQAMILGASDVVSFPDSTLINTDETTGKTISFWYSPDNSALSGNVVVYEEGGGTNGITAYLESGYATFAVNVSGSAIGSLQRFQKLVAGEAYHFVIRMDEGTFSAFVNGSTLDSFSVPMPFPRHGADVAIGGADGATKDANSNTISAGSSGTFQDLMYWAEQMPLTDAEIEGIYNAGTQAITQSITASAVNAGLTASHLTSVTAQEALSRTGTANASASGSATVTVQSGASVSVTSDAQASASLSVRQGQRATASELALAFHSIGASVTQFVSSQSTLGIDYSLQALQSQQVSAQSSVTASATAQASTSSNQFRSATSALNASGSTEVEQSENLSLTSPLRVSVQISASQAQYTQVSAPLSAQDSLQIIEKQSVTASSALTTVYDTQSSFRSISNIPQNAFFEAYEKEAATITATAQVTPRFTADRPSIRWEVF